MTKTFHAAVLVVVVAVCLTAPGFEASEDPQVQQFVNEFVADLCSGRTETAVSRYADDFVVILDGQVCTTRGELLKAFAPGEPDRYECKVEKVRTLVATDRDVVISVRVAVPDKRRHLPDDSEMEMTMVISIENGDFKISYHHLSTIFPR